MYKFYLNCEYRQYFFRISSYKISVPRLPFPDSQIIDIGFLIINPVCPKVEEDQDDSGIESKRQAQARSYLALFLFLLKLWTPKNGNPYIS